MQVVMEKAPEQRKFGLMGCDHCFCLGCIRSWRSQTSADLDTVRPGSFCKVSRLTIACRSCVQRPAAAQSSKDFEG